MPTGTAVSPVTQTAITVVASSTSQTSTSEPSQQYPVAPPNTIPQVAQQIRAVPPDNLASLLPQLPVVATTAAAPCVKPASYEFPPVPTGSPVHVPAKSPVRIPSGSTSPQARGHVSPGGVSHSTGSPAGVGSPARLVYYLVQNFNVCMTHSFEAWSMSVKGA